MFGKLREVHSTQHGGADETLNAVFDKFNHSRVSCEIGRYRAFSWANSPQALKGRHNYPLRQVGFELYYPDFTVADREFGHATFACLFLYVCFV